MQVNEVNFPKKNISFYFIFPASRWSAWRICSSACSERWTDLLCRGFCNYNFHIFSAWILSLGMLPWPAGLLHGNGKPSWSCHSHLGRKSKKEHIILNPIPHACQTPKSWLQGSVVVFSSWPNWTSEDMTSPDYCMETPMLFAFVLQIVRWVSGTLIDQGIRWKTLFPRFWSGSSSSLAVLPAAGDATRCHLNSHL